LSTIHLIKRKEKDKFGSRRYLKNIISLEIPKIVKVQLCFNAISKGIRFFEDHVDFASSGQGQGKGRTESKYCEK